ncbi:MAG: PD-(D/E)XK nuclease family protein [Nitrospirae bacterium]|nr:PD-(D/E)XK nuclease family protein [Nitrospirota bacterium]
MNTIIIQPQRGLIDEVLAHLSADNGDYSGNIVVFPGKRPSHFLRKAVGVVHGAAFIPPLLFSMDEFIDYLYEGRLGIYDRKAETIDAAAILFNIHRKNPLGGNGFFIGADSFFPLGLKLYRDFEEFCIEKIPYKKIREIETFADEKIPKETLKNLQSLSLFYKEFYEYLQSANFSTRSTRYRIVSERVGEVDLSPFKKIIFSGFFTLTKSENDLFNALSKLDNALFIFHRTRALRHILEGLGAVGHTSESEPERSAAPAIKIYKSPDTHGQVFALSRLLRDNPGHRDERTVVALPLSETVFPILHHGISMLEANAYNVSLGYPLLRTPVFGFFENLIDVVLSVDGDRLYVPAYIKFILHPYTKNIYLKGRTDATRIMFHTLEQRLKENSTKTFLTLREIEQDEEFLDDVTKQIVEVGIETNINEIRTHLKAIHNKTIRTYLSFKNTGDFAEATIALITYIYEESTARRHSFFFPFSEGFTLAAFSIANSMMRDVVFTETAGYFNLFKRYVATCYCPFEGMPLRGVQILGFLETRNIRFDNVYIMDVNEDALPNLSIEDSLLPFKARQILGLPTHIDKERLAASYFDTLIAGAKEVHIFFVENVKKEKSRFIEKILWDKQKDPLQSEAIIPIQYNVDLKNIPPAAVAKTGFLLDVLKQLNYSATSLDTYLTCPLAFYYRYVLRLEKNDQLTGALLKIDIGNFIHEVLCEYFKPLVGVVLSEADLDEHSMLEIVNARFEVFYGKDTAGAVYLLKKQLRRRMSDYLRRYAMPLIRRHEIKVLSLEEKIELIHRGYNLKGRLDKVELRDGKNIYIADYKTTANRRSLEINHARLDAADRATWSEAIGTLQMPFYLLLYSLKTGVSPETINGVFIQLGRTYIDESAEIPLFKDEPRRFEPLLTVINGILDEIHDPETPFTPTGNPKDDCRYCTYKTMCGT